MTSREPVDWLRDPELIRLRREWVAAYQAWTRLAGKGASINAELSDEQRQAESRYHNAEAAYFACSRMLAGGAQPDLTL